MNDKQKRLPKPVLAQLYQISKNYIGTVSLPLQKGNASELFKCHPNISRVGLSRGTFKH